MPGSSHGLAAMKDPTAFVKPEDVTKAINHEPDLRNQLIIRILFRGGMRESELCGILLRDILWDEKCLLVDWLKRRRKPGEQPLKRKIPIDQGTLDMIKEYLSYRKKNHLRGGDLSTSHLIPIRQIMVYKVVRRAFERIGIKAIGNPHGKILHHPHPHMLRHSYATARVNYTGGDYTKLRKIQLDMGHASIETTASYLNVDPKHLHEGYDEVFEGAKNG